MLYGTSVSSTSSLTFVILGFMLSAVLSMFHYGEGQIAVSKPFEIHIELGASIPGFQQYPSEASYEPDVLIINKTKENIPINSTVTVKWINDDESFHTVTSGILSTGRPDGKFGSGILLPKASYQWTFNDLGPFDYFCTVHPFMTGSVRIVER